MKKQNTLIAIDRDGTLIYDNKLHIGRTNDWETKIKVLPNVKKGISLLRKKLPKAKIYLISNQSGVAIKEFKLLTQERSEKVCNYIKDKLKLDGFISCGHVDKNYVKRRPSHKFINKLICDCSCIKPSPGMINQATKELNWKKEQTAIFVIGDRYIDVKTALNSKGKGIMIPFKNEPKELAKFKKHIKNKKDTYIAKDFLDACKWVISSSFP